MTLTLASPSSSRHEATLVLALPSRLVSQRTVRAVLGDALERCGWTGPPAWRVISAVNEATVNAIEHGSQTGGGFRLALRVTRDVVEIQVSDRGRPGACPPLGSATRPPERAIRGRGLLIMAGLADRMDLRAADGGTEVTLGFRR